MPLIKKFFIACICAIACVSCNTTSDPPPTILLKSDILVANKQKIKNDDPQSTVALNGLIAAADKALNNGPYAVTMKTKTPPSGDKHDYMSMGTYWWPDSTKPDGLPYIRKDGHFNPEIYGITDSEFFHQLCNDVQLLSVAYFFSDNTKYADKACEMIRVWFLDEATRMNPNLNYAQAIPGRTEGRGVGLIDTRMLIYALDGIQILKHAGRLSGDEYDGLQHWFGEYLEWMQTSNNGLDEAKARNNHGTYYDVQIVAMMLFAGKTAEAAKVLNETTKARISAQLEPDGRQPHELTRTISWTYSQMNLFGFFQLAAMAENANIDLWNYTDPEGKSIKKAYLWMLPYAEGKPWEYPQIKPINKSIFIAMTRIAARKYPDIDATHLLNRYQNDSDYLSVLIH